MLPVNFELSTPPEMIGEALSVVVLCDSKKLDLPHVSSPFAWEVLVAGSKDMPIEFVEMAPSETRLSVTVGMEEEEAGERVPIVRSSGPILTGRRLLTTQGLRTKCKYSPEDTIDTIESLGLENNISTLILKSAKREDRHWKRPQSIGS